MKKNVKIKAIEIGWGEASTFYTTESNGTEIIETTKIIKKSNKNQTEIVVYEVYCDSNLIATIPANENLNIYYKSEDRSLQIDDLIREIEIIGKK